MELQKEQSLSLSIIMPCLNEEQSVGYCVDEAKTFLDRCALDGEIIVVDNASTDNSAEAALKHGAVVVYEQSKGYGSAIKAGIRQSRGNVIIIGDCDTSYNFDRIGLMYAVLASGKCDVVIGNRYDGGFEKGSIQLSHVIGGRILSWCAGKRFQCDIYDFHCGLRGITRTSAQILDFQTDGMEFATEMIAAAKKACLDIGEVPVKLRRCRYKRKSKLRMVKDGMRHLRYIVRAK